MGRKNRCGELIIPIFVDLTLNTHFFLEYLFYTALIIHLLIQVRTIWPFWFLDQKENTTSSNTPFSLIICAHDELPNLKKLIPELLIQYYPGFEIIVALDRCKDGSATYLRNMYDPRLKIIEIHETPLGWDSKKYALNTAIKNAQNDWLLLTDADCLPDSKLWIQSFANKTNPKIEVILGVGAYRSEKHLVSQFTSYETFQTAHQYISSALRGAIYMGVGRNLAYRKSSFIKAGGFKGIAHLTGGDDDLLIQRIACGQNTAINLDKKSLTYSSPKRTWKGYLQQKTRHLAVGRYYKWKFQLEHTIRSLAHATLWLSFLYLLIFYPDPFRIISLFGVLVVVKGLFFSKISRKLGLSFHMSSYPVIDLIYAVFLPLLGVRASIVKKIPWK